MRRLVFLAVGVAGLLVAIGLAGFLGTRPVPSFLKLKPVNGVVVAGPAILAGGRTTGIPMDLGWCAGRPLATGEAVTAWTDVDPLGRTRVWRIERGGRPICRFTESTAALVRSNGRLRLVAIAAAALGLLGFGLLLRESRRASRRG